MPMRGSPGNTDTFPRACPLLTGKEVVRRHRAADGTEEAPTMVKKPIKFSATPVAASAIAT